MKRSRGRGRRGGPPNNQHRSFDSAGPEVKIRGTAGNVYEKYLQMARDAASQGDRVQSENYLQHAEHYYRIMMAQNAQNPQNGHQNGQSVQQGGNPQHANAQGHQNNNGNYQQPGNGNFQPAAQQPQPGSGPSFGFSDEEEGETDEAGA